MKHLILIILSFLLMSSLAYPAPFLICDPQTGVDHYKLTGPAWVPVSTPAQADGSIKLDVATSIVGSNSLTVCACKTDPIWGQLCSSTVPFVFSRPVSPSSPVNMKLLP